MNREEINRQRKIAAVDTPPVSWKQRRVDVLMVGVVGLVDGFMPRCSLCDRVAVKGYCSMSSPTVAL